MGAAKGTKFYGKILEFPTWSPCLPPGYLMIDPYIYSICQRWNVL